MGSTNTISELAQVNDDLSAKHKNNQYFSDVMEQIHIGDQMHQVQYLLILVGVRIVRL